MFFEPNFRLLLFIALLITGICAKAQPQINPGQWTWAGGVTTSRQIPVYGTKGQPAASNTPGSRTNSVTWVDNNGKFWLMGGNIQGGNSNDLWKYDTNSNQWTWMSGSSSPNARGEYYSKGTANIYTFPGARDSGIGWLGPDGNLWLMGGNAEGGALSDLWKYDISSGLWTWVGGDNTAYKGGVYGQKNVASPENEPGCRVFAASWTDGIGNLWLFGGSGANRATSTGGYLNDVWKYNVASGMWTWVAGSNQYAQPAVWGIKGVESVNNMPQSRYTPTVWKDKQGIIWLFGGGGYNNGILGVLGDLWRFNMTTGGFTWMGGDPNTSYAGSYGTKGIPAAGNMPKGRFRAAGWADNNNGLWLMGGGGGGILDDLWRYDIATGQWVWVNGNNIANQQAVYGTYQQPSISTKPGSRQSSLTWTDKNGNFWQYGGASYVSSTDPGGSRADLWVYKPVATISTPTVGASSVQISNLTSKTATISWKNGNGLARAVFVREYDSGTVTLPDGVFYTANTQFGSGSQAVNSGWYCVYNGTDTTVNVSGFTFGTGYRAAVFEYNASTTDIKYIAPNPVHNTKEFTTLPTPLTLANGQWTWASGSALLHTNGNPGIKGVGSPANSPKARNAAMNWKDKDGNFWVMGGFGWYDFGQRNDLWKYDTNTGEWTWMSGEMGVANPAASYGTLGVAAITNVPGARQDAYTWTDVNGDLWLFGGFGYTSRENLGYLNDIWKYNISTGLWAWVGGSNKINQYGAYGNKGVSSPDNLPGARRQGVTWTDGAGNFWLLGGDGYVASGVSGKLNDLWKYNIASKEWVWVSGNNTINKKGIYGTLGVPSVDNYPGGRTDAVSWTDKYGNLWLMGGVAYLSEEYNGGFGNDLWKFNISSNQWAWMSGGKIGNEVANYGTKGVPAESNVPGSKYMGNAWTDNDGNFWLMGGSGRNQYGMLGRSDETWVYIPSNGIWTWVDGSVNQDVRGIYGTKGLAAPTNRPGTRHDALTWTDHNNNLWLFGGSGTSNGSFEVGTLNDLWVYKTPLLSWVTPSLTSLIPDRGKLSPDFSADSTSYTINLPLTATVIRFTPTASLSNSKIKIQDKDVISGQLSDSVALVKGLNVINIAVSNDDETVRNYTVNVNVAKLVPQLILAIEPVTYGDADFDPAAISDNTKMPITYTCNNNDAVQIVNNKVRIIKNGTARITASQAAGKGYDQAVPVTQVLVVNKAPLTVKVKDKSRTYGSGNGTFSFTYTGFVNGESSSKLTGGLPTATSDATELSPVGNYEIKPLVNASDFYELIPESGILNVTKAPLMVTPQATSRYYGEENPEVKLTYTGLKNNETVSVLSVRPVAATPADIASPAGKYVITVNGGIANNYDFVYGTGELTVNRATLFLTAKSKTITYGTVIPALTLSYRGLANGDAAPGIFTIPPEVTTTATAASKAGNYPITVLGGNSKNYKLYYTNGTLTINKAIITITAQNKTRQEGQANPEFTLRYDGFVNGNGLNEVTIMPVVTTTATPTSLAGRYPIMASGAKSPYYAFNYVPGILNITEAPGSFMAMSSFNASGGGAITHNTPVDNDALTIHAALSPNGDGLNDYWLIENIEKYPQNQVTIVNRSGAAVYDVKGYDNAARRFEGYSSHNTGILQAGTYLYMIKYEAKGEQKSRSGYLIIK